MIRFIDLRHHEEDLCGDRFAFFSTCTDKFIVDNMGCQTWETLDDFVEARTDMDGEMTQRCAGLAPIWASAGTSQ